MYPDFFPGAIRNTMASSVMAPRLCMPMPKQLYPRSPLSPAKHTVARTSSCPPRSRGRCEFRLPQCRDCRDGCRRSCQYPLPFFNEAERQHAVEEYSELFSNPYRAAEKGYIDEIILPKYTRSKLIQALEMTANKTESNPPKKHGNMPL